MIIRWEMFSENVFFFRAVYLTVKTAKERLLF